MTIDKNIQVDEEQNTFNCFNCNNRFNLDVVFRHGFKNYCSDCYDELFFTCHNCSSVFDNDDMHNCEGDSFCRNCFNDTYFNCYDCGDTLRLSCRHHYHTHFNILSY